MQDKSAVLGQAIKALASTAVKGGRFAAAHPFATGFTTLGTVKGVNSLVDSRKAGESVSTPAKDFAKGTLSGLILPAGMIAAGAALTPIAPVVGPGLVGMGVSWLPWAAYDGVSTMAEGVENRNALRQQLADLKANPPTNPHINYGAAGLTGLAGLAGASILTNSIPWFKKRKRLQTIVNAALAAGAGMAGYYGAKRYQQNDARRVYDTVKV